MFGTCQISSQARSDKYGGASLCCAQRRLRSQNTNLTGPTPHNWGDHITHQVCSSTLSAEKLPARICAGGAGQLASLPRPKIRADGQESDWRPTASDERASDREVRIHQGR